MENTFGHIPGTHKNERETKRAQRAWWSSKKKKVRQSSVGPFKESGPNEHRRIRMEHAHNRDEMSWERTVSALTAKLSKITLFGNFWGREGSGWIPSSQPKQDRNIAASERAHRLLAHKRHTPTLMSFWVARQAISCLVERSVAHGAKLAAAGQDVRARQMQGSSTLNRLDQAGHHSTKDRLLRVGSLAKVFHLLTINHRLEVN